MTPEAPDRTTRTDGGIKLAGRFTRADGERVIQSGKHHELLELRAAIIESINHVESQLDEERTAGTLDPEWGVRARGAQRAYKTWLARISARLGESTASKPRMAVAIELAGRNTDTVVRALNELLQRGCQISTFAVVGSDLVVIATDPKP